METIYGRSSTPLSVLGLCVVLFGSLGLLIGVILLSPSVPSPAEPGQRRSMGTLNCEVGTPVEMCLAWTQVARLLSRDAPYRPGVL